MARQIFLVLKANPKWVATGKGVPGDYISLPNWMALEVPENATYSDVFAAGLINVFLNEKADHKAEIVRRHQRGKLAARLIERNFVDVPDGMVGEFESDLDNFIVEWFSKHPEKDATRKLQRQLWYKQYEASFQARLEAERKKAEISDLTKTATSSKLAEVKAQLPSLLERLNRATKETGKMSALAKFLGVPLASVSRWLSGKREPGGEITLKMLHWVEQQERQK